MAAVSTTLRIAALVSPLKIQNRYKLRFSTRSAVRPHPFKSYLCFISRDWLALFLPASTRSNKTVRVFFNYLGTSQNPLHSFLSRPPRTRAANRRATCEDIIHPFVSCRITHVRISAIGIDRSGVQTAAKLKKKLTNITVCIICIRTVDGV